MLTPEYLAGVSAPLQDIYGKLQAEIEADIARRIAKAGYLKVPDTAAWQIEKLQQMGASQQYIAQRISELGHNKATAKELESLFQGAGIKASATDEATRKAMLKAGRKAPTIPLTAAPGFRQVMEANMKRTAGSLQRLTGSMAEDAAGKLNQYLDHAQLMVQSGGFTVKDATDKAVKDFTGDGVTAFDYLSGARTSVEAAVRRAVVTGVNQATSQVSLDNAAALETDLVEVTSHADARPEHAAWQGKIYSISGTHPKYAKLSTATGYGTGAGLCGWNCRHSFYAFVEGISEPGGQEKYHDAVYQAEQQQRYNERMIRMWKRRVNTLEAGGVDSTEAQKRVRLWQSKQRDHVMRWDLARMYDREKVYGMTDALPRPKPSPEDIAKREAAAKVEAKKAAERERVRKWREAKKEAAKAAAEEADRLAAEAERAAIEASDRLKAEELARAKAEEKKAAERERVRKWRAAKKAEEDAKKAAAAEAAAKAAAEAAAKKAAEEAKKEAKRLEKERIAREVAAEIEAEVKAAAEAEAKKIAEAEAKRKAAEAMSKTPITAFSSRVGDPGIYTVYRDPGRGIPTDGITAFHGRKDAVGRSASIKEYDIEIKNPLVIEADTKAEARDMAFKKLTSENPRTFTGDKGAAVARELKAQGYDSILYKFPDDHFELDPIKFDMAKKSAAEEAAEKAAADAAAKKAAADKIAAEAAKKAAEKAAKKAAAEAKKKAAERAAARAAGGLPTREKNGMVPHTLQNFETHRDKWLSTELRGEDPGTIEAAINYVQSSMDTAAMRSRISQENLNFVLGDGKLKTQIELDAERKAGKGTKVTSGGMNNPDARKRASEELFGTNRTKTPATDYEYYGYVWDNDFVADFEWDGPSQYGGSTLQFRDDVRDRVTFTCGDSLGKSYVPSYLDEATPSWRLGGGHKTRKLAEAGASGTKPSVATVLDRTSCRYVEAQYHGGFTLDDVESFVIGPNEYARHGLDKKLAKELNERGIKVGVVEFTGSRGSSTTFRWLKEEDWLK